MDRICYGLYILQLLLNLLKFRMKSFCCSRFVFSQNTRACTRTFVSSSQITVPFCFWLYQVSIHTFRCLHTFVHFLQFYYFYTSVVCNRYRDVNVNINGYFLKFKLEKAWCRTLRTWTWGRVKNVYIFIYIRPTMYT